MKKLLFLLVLSFIWINTIVSQDSKNAKVTMGPAVKLSKRATLTEVLDYSDKGFFGLMIEGKGFAGLNRYLTLESYNKAMSLEKTVEVDLKQGDKEKTMQNLIHFNNSLYLFSSFDNKKTDVNYLFMQTIDKKSLQPHNNLEKISEINYAKQKGRYHGSFEFRTSNDSSKLLVVTRHPSEDEAKQSVEFKVFDSNMSLLWQKTVKLPYEYNLFDTERFRVGNNGDVFVLSLLFKDKRKLRRKGDPNYSYIVLGYSDNGNSVEEYPIVIPDRFITDMQIEISDENNIICSGFYSEKGTWSIKGAYFLTVNGKNKEVMAVSYKDFDLDFITMNMTEREAKKTKKKADKGKNVELYEYDLREIILRNDGGALVVGEQYFVKVVTTTYTSSNGVPRTKTTYYYYYNTIIVLNINSEGKIEWARKIPKYQVSTDDGGYFLSYAIAVVKDNLYFVFNDNPKNLFLKENDKPAKYYNQKESIVTLVKMDSKGNMEREELFRNKEAKIIARPKVCQQVSENQMLVFGERGKTRRFARLDFN
jgi:hypothetical protein